MARDRQDLEVEPRQQGSIMEDIAEAFQQKDTTAGVQAIKEIFNSENLKMKSETKSEIGENFYYARNYSLAKLLSLPELETFCNTELALKVSSNRRGRREAVEISRQSPEQPRTRGLFGGLFG